MKCKVTDLSIITGSHKFLFPLAFLLLICVEVPAQDQPIHPAHVQKADFFAKTIPLREMEVIQVKASEGEGEVKELIHRPDFEKRNFINNHPEDLVLQNEMGSRRPAGLEVNNEGTGNLQNVLPPDPEGDVGPDHYMQMINMSFAVYDKAGNLIYGPADNASIWQNVPAPWSGSSNGDPICLYDQEAGRWLISELSLPTHPYGPYYMKIAVSETPDPTGAWYLYGFQYDYFCDYPKMGIWHDAYYMTTNNNFYVNDQWDFHGVGVSVFERDSMLAGSPDARRIFFDFAPNTDPWSVLPVDFDGTPPPEDRPAYLAYYEEGYIDKVIFYEVETDWIDPDNSTLGMGDSFHPEAFTDNLPNGIPQPEGAPYLAPMSNRLLYRLQYRNFGSHESMVTNHTINAGTHKAGIRWYEFRDSGSGWEIYQQGTYSPDEVDRWMGSIAMDGYGNIALGYSVSSEYTYPSIRYTGRLKDDPLGQMTIAEQEIIAGSGVQLNYNHRWGDYSCMSVDPLNHATFWYTQQYYEVTGNRSWQTRIAAFNLIEPLEVELSAEADSICSGDSLLLFSTPFGGSGNYEYTWSSEPPGFSSGQQNPRVSPDTTTLYFCEVNDGVATISDSIQIGVQPAAVAVAGPDTLICEGQSYHNTAAEAENYSGLLWHTSGDGTFDDPAELFSMYTPGSGDIAEGSVNLSLTAYPLALCDTVTDTLKVYIDPCTLVAHESSNPTFSIRPNPAKGSFVLIMRNIPGKEAIFILRDLSGRTVLKEKLAREADGIHLIDISMIPEGMYVAGLQTPLYRKLLKLVVM